VSEPLAAAAVRYVNTQTHTHTDRQTDRERERETGTGTYEGKQADRVNRSRQTQQHAAV